MEQNLLTEITTEKFRKQELNRLAFAMKQFERAKENLHFAHKRYSEVVHNQCYRDWIYTDYEDAIKKLLTDNNISKTEINNPKIFQHILNMDKKYYEMFSISKEVVEFVSPETIEDLANVFAIGHLRDLTNRIEILKKSKKIPEYIKPVLKDTYNQILYEEQIKKILTKMFGKRKDVNAIFYGLLWDIRYLLDECNIFKQIAEDENFAITKYIKSNYNDIYTLYLKIPYVSIKEALTAQDVSKEDTEKIIDVLIFGILNCCKKSKAIKCAKYLYKLAESDVKL